MSNSDIDLGRFLVNIMIVQSPQFFAKLAPVLKEATGEDLYIIRGTHHRIYAFKCQLEAHFDTFIKTPDNANFEKLGELLKRHEVFDSIAHLKAYFVKKGVLQNEGQMVAMSKFFNGVAKTPANQALIAAFKPVADSVREQVEAADSVVVRHSHVYA